MNISRNVLITILISIVINYSYAKPTRSLSQNKFPITIRVLNEGDLKYGSTFSVECTTETNIISIKWVRESLKSRAYFSEYNNIILMTINSIIPMDFGKYTCIATRADGVQVSSSIRIERNPNYGNRFRYRLDSDKQHSDNNEKAEELKSDKITDNNNKDSDSDSNSNTVYGSISDQTEVRIAQDFQTYTHEGETVSFTCLINDENRTDIAWTRNHGAMPPTHKIVDNTLILCNVTHEDTGYYICSYKDKSTYVYLGLVRGGHPITYVKIPSKAKQINVIEGDQVEIDCTVVGELDTNLRWEKHQSSLPDNVIVEDNKLKIKSVRIDNYGYYECLGENILGNFSDFVYLDIKNKSEVLLAKERVTQIYYPDEQEETTVSVVASSTTPNPEVQEENTENETETTEHVDVDENSNEDTTTTNNNNDGEVSNEVTETSEDVEVEANQNDSITTTPAVSSDESEPTTQVVTEEQTETETTSQLVTEESTNSVTEETPSPNDPTPAIAETSTTDVAAAVAEEEESAVVTESVQEEEAAAATQSVQEELATDEEIKYSQTDAITESSSIAPESEPLVSDEPAAEESTPGEQASEE